MGYTMNDKDTQLEHEHNRNHMQNRESISLLVAQIEFSIVFMIFLFSDNSKSLTPYNNVLVVMGVMCACADQTFTEVLSREYFWSAKNFSHISLLLPTFASPFQ